MSLDKVPTASESDCNELQLEIERGRDANSSFNTRFGCDRDRLNRAVNSSRLLNELMPHLKAIIASVGFRTLLNAVSGVESILDKIDGKP